MERITLMARVGLLALAVATAAGCASSPQQSTQATQEPRVQLQDPDTTPREKWSDAMIILHGDMGIVGQKDIPRSLIDSTDAAVLQNNARLNGNAVLPAGGVGLAASSYVAPPTGFSAAGAAGAGLALGFLTSYQPTGPSMFRQLVAWVPADKASSMEEAIDVALKEFTRVHNTALDNPYPSVDLLAAKYPEGYSPSIKYASGLDVLKNNPIRPSGNAEQGPSILPDGKYYGPIFFDEFHTLIRRAAYKNKTSANKVMLRIDAQLPDWFVMYSPGLPTLKSSAGVLPSVFHKGQEHFFIGK